MIVDTLAKNSGKNVNVSTVDRGLERGVIKGLIVVRCQQPYGPPRVYVMAGRGQHFEIAPWEVSSFICSTTVHDLPTTGWQTDYDWRASVTHSADLLDWLIDRTQMIKCPECGCWRDARVDNEEHHEVGCCGFGLFDLEAREDHWEPG